MYLKDLPAGQPRRLTHTLYQEGNPAWSRTAARSFATWIDGGVRRLEIVDVSTGASRPLTANWQHSSRPNWSPDGKKIVFESETGGSPQLAIIAPGGGSPTLLNLPGSHPAWSPDGTRLLYTRTEGGVFTATSGGTDQRLLIPEGDEPGWSPDGLSIVYIAEDGGATRLFTATANGSNRQPVPGSPSGAHRPDW